MLSASLNKTFPSYTNNDPFSSFKLFWARQPSYRLFLYSKWRQRLKGSFIGEPIIRNFVQILEVTKYFLEYVIDSLSEEEESASSVFTLFSVPSIRLFFIIIKKKLWVMSIHQLCPHPPPSSTRGHAANIQQTVVPGINGWHTRAIKFKSPDWP